MVLDFILYFLYDKNIFGNKNNNRPMLRVTTKVNMTSTFVDITKQLKRFVSRIVQPDDVEDIVQETFIKSYEADLKQDIQLRTTAISDTMFLKLISFGRIFSPNVENIDELYNIGFKQVAIECYTDLVEGNLDFENSELHDIVFQAFDKCLENTARPEVILELLQEDETT